MALIQAKYSENIAAIAFDNYSKRNALSAALISETIAALEQFRTKGARVAVLRSAAGENIWSAGHDVSELPKADIDPLPSSDPLDFARSICSRHNPPGVNTPCPAQPVRASRLHGDGFAFAISTAKA